MLGHDYTCRHNEVLRCNHLLLANKYGLNKTLRSHSFQEVMKNKRTESQADTSIWSDILVKINRSDIFIYDKRENAIILVKIRITSHYNIQAVKTKKKKKYGLLPNELDSLYKAKTKIIHYVMIWTKVVTKYPRNYLKKLNISFKVTYTNRRHCRRPLKLYY
ncbi:hypothetical protein TCON_1357 [Astathelohania contejeani]|uniref:Uncharacterized protein n=1 Tax=Astathelohania contejeani TaxID=164912 RepID=A0ABQ7HZ18_9MICR|nr:hypothetical protein TCON_1357 [Thelohania contejeani]